MGKLQGTVKHMMLYRPQLTKLRRLAELASEREGRNVSDAEIVRRLLDNADPDGRTEGRERETRAIAEV